MSIRLVKQLSENPKGIAKYDVRNVGLPKSQKGYGNGVIIVIYTNRNCWCIIKSNSRPLRDIISNLYSRWTQTHGRFSYEIFSTKV